MDPRLFPRRPDRGRGDRRDRGGAAKNLTKAIEAQRRLTAEHPQDPAVFNDLGNLLMLVPQAAEAEAAYRKAIELDPNKASALFNLGLLLQQRGELREAEDLYQRAVKADPNHAWAHYQLGTIEEARGRNRRRSTPTPGRSRSIRSSPSPRSIPTSSTTSW